MTLRPRAETPRGRCGTRSMASSPAQAWTATETMSCDSSRASSPPRRSRATSAPSRKSSTASTASRPRGARLSKCRQEWCSNTRSRLRSLSRSRRSDAPAVHPLLSPPAALPHPERPHRQDGDNEVENPADTTVQWRSLQVGRGPVLHSEPGVDLLEVQHPLVSGLTTCSIFSARHHRKDRDGLRAARGAQASQEYSQDLHR